MKLCDLTLPTPEENLACDEASLDLAEQNGSPELLRFWTPTTYFVVVGYANRIATEVDISFCERMGIPVYRRCSGGGTVLQGPGCLNYTLILDSARALELKSITSTNSFILGRLRNALTPLLGQAVETKGHTDLAIGGIKFCGNAQRRKKTFVLFHGSFLLNMDIGLIEQALPMPSKQPDYRANRPHSAFLTNLQIRPDDVKSALAREWQIGGVLSYLPRREIDELVRQKYANPAWNQRF